LVEAVPPATRVLPAESTAISLTASLALPPRYVEYENAEPAAFNFVTKPSFVPPPEIA
jgi:hypothetical protein